jgi:hypothetical protein
MGILKSAPTAATLTAQLGGVLAEINRLRADIATLLESASTDQDHHRLNVMRSRLDTARAKETKLRAEIAGAVESERLVERDTAFDVAVAIGNQAAQAGAELAKVIAGVWPAVRKLIELDDAFRAAVPVRPPDWDEHAFTRDLISLILNELYVASEGRLRGTTGLVQSPHQLAQNPLFSIEGALREHLAMGFKARPSKQESAQSTSTTGPEPVAQES